MLTKKVVLKSDPQAEWWLWSDNTDEIGVGTLSCLPYRKTDEASMFVWDLKEFDATDCTVVDSWTDLPVEIIPVINVPVDELEGGRTLTDVLKDRDAVEMEKSALRIDLDPTKNIQGMGRLKRPSNVYDPHRQSDDPDAPPVLNTASVEQGISLDEAWAATVGTVLDLPDATMGLGLNIPMGFPPVYKDGFKRGELITYGAVVIDKNKTMSSAAVAMLAAVQKTFPSNDFEGDEINRLISIDPGQSDLGLKTERTAEMSTILATKHGSRSTYDNHGRRPFRWSVFSRANEKFLVPYKNKKILVHQFPIPGFRGSLGQSVLDAAAAFAYRRGWKKVIIDWIDSPVSTCFEDGKVHLVCINAGINIQDGAWKQWRDDVYLCDMDGSGEIPVPPDPRDDSIELYEYWPRGDFDWN